MMRAPRLLRRARARLRYRGGQFFRGLHSRLGPGEIAAVRALLSPRELRLFLAMEARDRRHSMDVLRWLEMTSGSAKPSEALRRAALLHDVGKGRLWVWDRVAYVLLEAVSPRLLDAVGAPAGGPTAPALAPLLARRRRALWRLRHHAELGARALAEGGTDPRTIELVARHLDPTSEDDAELARLIEADRAS